MQENNTTHASAEERFLIDAYQRLRQSLGRREWAPLPSATALNAAVQSLPVSSWLAGVGPDAALEHVRDHIVPGLNGQALSPRYYGFVTGGTLPVAEAADNIVSALDQNVQVHLPSQTVSTLVEDAALKMVAALLELEPDEWPGRTFTTGATASNVLGLACAREAVISRRLDVATAAGGEHGPAASVGELGLLQACMRAGVREIQVLTSMGHSSLYKAASVVGLGRSSVKSLPLSEAEPFRLDLAAVEREARKEGVATIIVLSAGEVNTGGNATSSRTELQELRAMADRHGAWIHVDGAFGAFYRVLPKTAEFAKLHDGVAGLELADSITLDGHKLLNVPYDNGIFLTRDPKVQNEVFKNPNAAYLATSGPQTIQSPLNIGIENSRRFRALPAYAVLLSEGQKGMAAMMTRMVRMARRVAAFVRASEAYELLVDEDKVGIVVLFRARDRALNEVLVQQINDSGQMYVSPTSWNGEPATRIAVSSWRVDVERDVAIVEQVLAEIARRERV